MAWRFWGSLIALAVAGAMLATPAIATACPSLSQVQSFHGTISESISQSANGGDGNGGNESVTLDHAASLSFASIAPVGGTHHHDFEGLPTGGSVQVNDKFSDTSQYGATTGEDRSAAGPPTNGQGSVIAAAPQFALFGSCLYAVSMRFFIVTTSNVPGRPNEQLTEVADSPLKTIPPSLQLAGSATVNVYCTTPQGGGFATALKNGQYDLQGSNYDEDAEYCGASGGSQGHPVGMGTISWNLSPTLASTKKIVFVIVSASTIRPGKTSLITFRATWNRQPASGAIIKIAGHTLHAGKNGKVSVRLHPKHAGRLLATISYRGRRTTAVIHVS